MNHFLASGRLGQSGQTAAASRGVRSSVAASTANRSVSRTNQRPEGTGVVRGTSAADNRLFTQCIEQVQRQLKSSVSSPSTLYTLASYYTREEPYIEGRPFCVSLSFATFLYHIQMARVSEGDVQLYVQLISAVLAQIPRDAQLQHAFVLRVLRDAVFGIPSPTCVGGAHCVVLVPPLQYRAFAYLAISLVDLGIVPEEILCQWQDRLEAFCRAQSPLVANRALALIVHTVGDLRMDEQISALQYVLKTKPRKMNVDFLLACYERLKRAVPEPVRGPTYGRAISIHCSELFLRFRSPIRREYVERFLYPSLSSADMQTFVQIPATRRHLCSELLRQCTPGMSPANTYYLCLCAIMQWAFNNEIDGAVELVELINCQMPHAAYFAATLAVDGRMSVSMFAKIMIALVRGAGLAMTGREVEDDVASVLQSHTSVYNVLFLLREVVRNCSVTASRHASDMLRALCVAIPEKSVETLGKLAAEAFEDLSEAIVDPQLLCAELAMALHQLHIDEAMDAVVAHLRDVTAVCIFCGLGRGASAICEVNGTMHMTGQVPVGRVLTTLGECAGMPSVERKLIKFLRDPSTQMDSAVHFMLFHIFLHAGQHRNTLFVAVEPYIRSTLMTLISADRASASGLVGSQQKANVLMLHVKLVIFFANTVDPTYVESILRAFCELRIRNNHDALALWYMANLLLRQGKGNVELLPTDPAENNYCVNFPSCAPMCNTTADNAQMLLKIIDRSHSFSDAMRKLVGCCVCKLIQDFNVQAPNIIGTLLSPFGFVPVGLRPLSDYALPVGASSTFWSFVVRQMKSSAVARTAFMTALAKSISQRFSIANPANALVIDGMETTGHLFAVMVYEAMKRNPPLSRVVLHMISQWVKQPQHPPGRFVCLVYICLQLYTVVRRRGEGAEGVELTAETREDTAQFSDALEKASKVIHTQLPRLSELGPLVREENSDFYRIVRSLGRKARLVVGDTTEGASQEENSFVFINDNDDVFNVDDTANNEDVTVEETSGVPVGANGGGDYIFDDLHRPEDDSFFSDHMGDNNIELQNPSVTLQTENSLPQQREADNSKQSESHTRDEGQIDVSVTASSVSRGRKKSLSFRQDVSTMTSPAANSVASVSSRRPREVSFVSVADAEGVNANTEKEHCTVLPLPISETTRKVDKAKKTFSEEVIVSRSLESRGVQTSPLEKEGGQLSSCITDKSSFWREAEKKGKKSKTATNIDVGGDEGCRYNWPELPPPTSDDGDVAWREPNFEGEENNDEEPIDNLALPVLQALGGGPSVDGVNIPSGLVLEYLSTHQEATSALHELHQLEGEFYTRRAQEAVIRAPGVNNYHEPHTEEGGGGHACNTAAAPPHTAILPVTVERRPNNYSVPHATRAPAPTKTVMARLTMIQTPGGQTQHDVQVDVEKENAELFAKRRRVDGGETNKGLLNEGATVAMQSPVKKMGAGVQFFLQQNAASVMKDLGGMRKQVDAMSTVMTPHRGSNVPALLNQAVTPYGQVMIPQCFIEQKNDTAMREIRQVMGAHNPNDGRLSGGGRRKIYGSRLETERGSTPLPPAPAVDARYSMELF